MRTLLLSTFLILGAASVSPAAPTLPDKPAKWEYAELTYRAIASRPAGVDADGKAIPAAQAYIAIRWVTGAGEVEAKGWEELAERLKAPALKNGTLVHKKIQMLNHLGGEGWELMDQQTGSPSSARELGPAGPDRFRTTSSTPTTWLLKRRVP